MQKWSNETGWFLSLGNVEVIGACSFQGSLEFVEQNGCTFIFEFTTREACHSSKKVNEIPCSIIDRNKKIRDLTQLVQVKGMLVSHPTFWIWYLWGLNVFTYKTSKIYISSICLRYIISQLQVPVMLFPPKVDFKLLNYCII